MSKAFTKETDGDDEDLLPPELVIPATVTKNYMTPGGYQRMKSELKQLVEVERPSVTQTVSWAASNGDRSENGEYIYGKRRLREIDRRRAPIRAINLLVRIRCSLARPLLIRSGPGTRKPSASWASMRPIPPAGGSHGSHRSPKR